MTLEKVGELCWKLIFAVVLFKVCSSLIIALSNGLLWVVELNSAKLGDILNCSTQTKLARENEHCDEPLQLIKPSNQLIATDEQSFDSEPLVKAGLSKTNCQQTSREECGEQIVRKVRS